MKSNYIFVLLLIVAAGITGLACEGPVGEDRLQGPQGPIGPAGEDGSMIYAGEGEPGVDVGDIGDYYLDRTPVSYTDRKKPEDGVSLILF